MTGARRAVPAALVWLLVAHVGLLALAAVVYPVWRSPDEGAHVDMVRLMQRTLDYPTIGERQISRNVVESFDRAGIVDNSPGTSPPLRADDAPPRHQRPTLPEIAPDEAPSALRQQMSQHPPLYYVGLGAARSGLSVLPGVPSEAAFDAEVTLLRLLSALLLVPLPLLAFVAARQVTGEGPALAAAAVAASVPQLTHVGSAVNNDSLLVVTVSAMVPLALWLGRGRGDGRHFALLGALAGVAVLAKGFGLFTPLWLVVTGMAAARWIGRREAGRRTAVALVASFVVGGWWYVRNLAVEGALQPSGIGYPAAPEGFRPDWSWWGGFFWQRFTDRFWFEPNIVATDVPVEQALSVVGGLLVVAGFVVLVRARRLGAAVLLAVPPVGLLAITVLGAANYYRTSGAPFGIHGRYTYPAIVAVAVLAVLAAARLGRWLPVAAGAVLVVVHGLALWWALERYWHGDGLLDRVASLRAWAPVPWGFVLLALAISGVAMAGFLATAWRGGSDQPTGLRRGDTVS